MSDVCYTNTLETDGLSTGEILRQAKATLHSAHQRACKALEMVQGLLRRHPKDGDLLREKARLFDVVYALNNARSGLPYDIAKGPTASDLATEAWSQARRCAVDEARANDIARARTPVSPLWDTAVAAMMGQREAFQAAPTVRLTGEEADELMAQAEAHDWREGGQ